MKKAFSRGGAAYCALALIWWIVTFFTDHTVFEALEGRGVAEDLAALGDESRAIYTACKLLLLLLLIIICKTVYELIRDAVRAVREKTPAPKGASVAWRILPYCLAYLLPVIAVLVFKLPEGFLSNDERLIFQEASSLNNYTWFYYLTTYYYVTAMMLIPSWLGPILVKVALQVVVCGYCVYRFHRFTKSRWAFLMYIPFLLFPVLAYTTSAHRIPVYYLVYLLFVVKLAMDRCEQKGAAGLKCEEKAGEQCPKRADTGKNGEARDEHGVKSPAAAGLKEMLGERGGILIALLFAAALITQWRTEGIYMLPLSVILLSIAYPALVRDRDTGRVSAKRMTILILACILMQYAVSVPQNGLIPNRMGDKADNRMGPFWAYTITNMYRNGLDLEKNRDDMEKVYRFLDRDVLRSINEDLGDINYEDTLILYYPGYVGQKPEADTEDYNAYVEGCKNIFKNNPDVFLRTRWGAFRYAALPYSVGTDEGGLKGLIKLAFSAFKATSYNLFIPCLLVPVFLVIALVKRKWLEFFIFGGLVCHWFIVFILAPASYFKYYLPVYMIAYFGLFAAITILPVRRKGAAPAGN